MTSASRLEGSAMLACIDNLVVTSNSQCRVATTSDKAIACGYIKADGRPDLVPFYDAMLAAKGNLDDDADEQMRNIRSMLCGRHGNDAVDAFEKCFGEDYLNNFEDAYQGKYHDGADFARKHFEKSSAPDPDYFVEDDWEATWQNLSCDYLEDNGYVFKCW